MKKVFSLIMAVVLAFGVCSVAAFAETAADVYVSIADASGALALAYAPVHTTDADGDGAITLNDALLCAHTLYYKDGASGYATANGDYGLYIVMLWGAKNGSGFGYYVNNGSAWTAKEPVASGDHVYAFVYTDTVNYSDTYAFFDVNTVDTTAYVPFELTLQKLVFDMTAGTYVTAPVSNAVIRVDGKDTKCVTDENGKATLTLTAAGTHTISAGTADCVLTPPVCVANTAKGSVTAAIRYYIRLAVQWILALFGVR